MYNQYNTYLKEETNKDNITIITITINTKIKVQVNRKREWIEI